MNDPDCAFPACRAEIIKLITQSFDTLSASIEKIQETVNGLLERQREVSEALIILGMQPGSLKDAQRRAEEHEKLMEFLTTANKMRWLVFSSAVALGVPAFFATVGLAFKEMKKAIGL